MNPFRRESLRNLLLGATVLSSTMILLQAGRAFAQVEAVVSCDVAPPVLPVYAQPAMPEEGYVWTPGYWQWVAPTGYYWVPGTWVLPPTVNVFWTPPYWGWSAGLYVFHGGYWGSQVGFYGGVNYGYGYGGSGYQGGRWEGGHFAYNSAVNNFGSVHVANTYRQNVSVNTSNRISYNGGPGGVRAEPNAQERSFQAEPHQAITAEQSRHISAAAVHPGLVANTNHGHPQIAATARPAEFEGRGVVAPREAAEQARPAQQHVNQATARPAQQHAGRSAQVQHQQVHQAVARPVPQHGGGGHPAPQQMHQAAARPQQQHAAPHEGSHQEARR